MFRLRTLVPCLLLLLLAGCRAPAPETIPPSPTGVATATPIAEARPTPEEPPTQAATEVPPARPPLPAPTLFETDWDDREPFRDGLIESEQAILDDLPGASVYHLDVALATSMTEMTGKQEIRYTNQEEEPLDEIYFRLYPNLLGGSSTVSALTVNGEAVEPSYELEDSALRLLMDPPLEPEEQVVIALEFEVTIPESSEGNYGSFAFTENILALAHFYPIIAAYDEEGWNIEIPAPSGDLIHADSSFYLVRVTAPAQALVVGSGIQDDKAAAAGSTTHTFTAGPTRDFYLAASDQYEQVSVVVGETTLYSYAPSEMMGAAREALDRAKSAMEVFNAMLGPYPFTEFDMIGTPNLALGIEYPGIVAITTRLYDPTGPMATRPVADITEATVAHEVGHQWFYSTVGNDQLDEPWLDESLVQYITLLYYQSRYGSAGSDGFRSSLTGRWESIGNEEIPIGLPVAGYDEVGYSAIIYGRGPLFFEALAEEMGAEPFGTFLRDYYAQYKFGIATTEGFKELAEEHCACDLTPLFEEWIFEE